MEERTTHNVANVQRQWLASEMGGGLGRVGGLTPASASVSPVLESQAHIVT